MQLRNSARTDPRDQSVYPANLATGLLSLESTESESRNKWHRRSFT